jgi:hypothetical protein
MRKPIPAQIHPAIPAGDNDDVVLQPLALNHPQNHIARPASPSSFRTASPFSTAAHEGCLLLAHFFGRFKSATQAAD